VGQLRSVGSRSAARAGRATHTIGRDHPCQENKKSSLILWLPIALEENRIDTVLVKDENRIDVILGSRSQVGTLKNKGFQRA
jgi:hypothetical protein